MNSFSDTVRAFAHRLGCPAEAGSRGRENETVAEFVIERVGRLQLETADECALATLARPVAPDRRGPLTAALELGHWRENHPWPLNAGLTASGWLTLTAAAPLEGFDLPALERMLSCLSGLHDRLATWRT